MSAPPTTAEAPGPSTELRHVDLRGTGERAGFEIFISYRVRPDEGLASELKLLLEHAIDPQPRVFVSGLGGLRASAEGYREQLRAAATNAAVYVALISSSSLDREWIFFEAGAAFGRRVMYVPVLVDVEPDRLPSSLGAYQATRGSDPVRMRDMVDDIAKELGSTLRPRFTQRYSRFRTVIQDYNGQESDDDDDGDGEADGIAQGIRLALRLAGSGKRDDAARSFDALLDRAKTEEEKASIAITKSIALRKGTGEVLDAVEEQSEDVRATATYKMMRGLFEVNPVRAVPLLRAAWDGDLSRHQRRWMLASLTRSECELGEFAAARERLVEALASEDRRLRAVAAKALANDVGEVTVLDRLVLLVEATVEQTREHLNRVTRYCFVHQFSALGLYMATLYVEKEESGEAHINRGLLRSQNGLTSLAFRDFRIAAKDGISVAVSNMAGMLLEGAVPEAGLELLREYAENYDSMDPGGPYEVRATGERAVGEEIKKERKICDYGKRIAVAVHRLVETWLRCCRRCAEVTVERRWSARASSGTWELLVTRSGLQASCNDQEQRIEPLALLPGYYGAYDEDEGLSALLVVCGDEIEGVSLIGPREAEKLEWLRFAQVEAHG